MFAKLPPLVQFLLAMLLFAVSCSRSASPADGDNQGLNGAWTVAAGERAGAKIPNAEARLKVFVIKDETLFMRGSHAVWGKLKLDPNQSLKTIDITARFGDDDEQESTQRGIYEVQGDLLKLCVNGPGEARPTEFATAGDPHREFLLLKRVPTNEPEAIEKRAGPIPIPNNESPKEALLRGSQVYEQLSVAADMELYSFSGKRAADYVRSECTFDDALVRVELAVRERFGSKAEDALLHALGQKTDDDIQQAECKIDGDHCAVHYPGDPDDAVSHLLRVNGAWKVEAAQELQGQTKNVVKAIIKTNVELADKIAPLAAKVKAGELKTFEEIVLEVARLTDPPED